MTFPSANALRRSRRAFTMTEILVVVGILLVLASIGLVVGSRAFATADKVRLRAQMQTIERALDAYQTDFGSYPLTNWEVVANQSDEINREGLRGARTLCKALVAPTPGVNPANAARNPSYEDQDGKLGPGFRVLGRSGVPRYKGGALAEDELQGKEYGPYLQDGAVKWSKTNDNGTLDADKDYDDTTVLLDANDNVILYYPPLNTQPVLTALGSYVGTGPSIANRNQLLPMYRWTDNSTWVRQELLRSLLGDKNNDGAINANATDGEAAVVKGKPLLISPGRDGLFGPNPSDKNKTNDDVMNFMD